jgi:glycosyltransferase involved in cell wall biosynthesis
MPRFHIVTPNIVAGDAIAQDALGMLHALRKNRCEAYLYAEEYDRDLRNTGGSLEDYETEASHVSEDILIYHHAVGWRPGAALFKESRNHRILKFHNITPASFFEGINQEYANSCTEGVLQTQSLLECSIDLCLADSLFNARQLMDMGADSQSTFVLPPFHEIESLRRTHADWAVLKKYQDDIRNILFVGRVAPNKGHLELIDTFAHYHRYLNPRSRLFIVGALDPRLEPYTQRIQEKISREGLAGAVTLTGKVSSDQLKAYYLTAHAFLCTSHHEGFCVPLVEAMAFKVPCVAWAVTGVAGTLGRRALAWETLDPSVLAEGLHECLENPEVADRIVAWQMARYHRLFATSAVERRFLSILRNALDERHRISFAESSLS